jgi:rhodanese-related sulfurtransferase
LLSYSAAYDPQTAMTVDDLLRQARDHLDRLDPYQAAEAINGNDAVLIDIRSESQRAGDGTVPGARFVPRNVLEWRCDPESKWRDPEIARPELRLIVMCNEGYQSSLAAAALQQLGLPLATDLIGGFQAWRAAGLSVDRPSS